MSTFIQARRDRAAAAWDLRDEIVLVGAGELIPIPGGADQTYHFLSHAEYFYLADRECPGAVLAFDPHDGWRDFAPAITEEDRVWVGRAEAGGDPLPELAAWLAARRGRPLAMLGAELPGLRPDRERTERLREVLSTCRRPKDREEIARARRACAATAEGYRRAREVIRPGVTERAVQIEMDAEFQRHGADRAAYGSIVGSGPNAAVFHGVPGPRVIEKDDVILIDAGAEIRRYCADVTRTFPAAGDFTPVQRDLYAVVLRTLERGIARCVPGAEWRDVHLAAARDLVEGLVDLGIMRGRSDALVERGAHLLFFPHGIGHLVGLGVRDASGRLPGRPRATDPALAWLRMDLPLEVNYLLTVEPGIYFIPAILQDRDRRARYRDDVDWARAESLIPLGGIRIEDNILVTASGPDNLTAAIPKTL